MIPTSNFSSKWKEVLGFDNNNSRPLTRQNSLSRPRNFTLISSPSPLPKPSLSLPSAAKAATAVARARARAAAAAAAAVPPPPLPPPPSQHLRNLSQPTRSPPRSSPPSSPVLSPLQSSRPKNTSSPSSSTSSSSSSSSSFLSQPLPPLITSNSLSYPRFPRDITFFHSNNEVLITASTPSPSTERASNIPLRPLFFITLSTDGISHPGRPDITLHAGPDKASTALCFAKIYSSNPISDMTLCPPPKKPISANFSADDFAIRRQRAKTFHYKSPSTSSTDSTIPSRQKSSSLDTTLPRFRMERLVEVKDPISLSQKYVFFFGREIFEWRHPVRRPQGGNDGNGMKLVRASTGEVVVYAHMAAAASGRLANNNMLNHHMATGVMRFRRSGNLTGLGEDFEIMAVVSMMSIVEKERIDAKRDGGFYPKSSLSMVSENEVEVSGVGRGGGENTRVEKRMFGNHCSSSSMMTQGNMNKIISLKEGISEYF